MPRFKIFNRDKSANPISRGVVTGLMETCYIALVVLFMVGTQSLFNDSGSGTWRNAFSMVAFLSLLVLSVGVSAVLVFGWPAEYFMEKKYEAAMQCIGATVGTMFVLFAIVFLAVSLTSLISF